MSIELNRLKKIKDIVKQGINPYPSQGKRTYTCKEADSNFSQIEKAKKNVILAGRLVLLRLHGKACFANLEDFSGRFQLFLNQDNLGEKNYAFFVDNIDVGDFIKAIRQFFDKRGFFEVETPILQSLAGGATAKPFVTHHKALNTDLYLRIAPELYLKRLIIGGFEKVYEVARCFRNEGIDRTHNPEFTQIEFYQAYADYNDLMALTEELMVFLLENLGIKNLQIEYKCGIINFKPPYPKLDFRQALIDNAGIDIDEYKKFDDLVKQAKKLGLKIDKTWGKGKILDGLYKEFVLSKIIQPTFIVDYPIELSPLAKKILNRPNYVERFQLLINGTELCNAFSELNDPIDQELRFKEQQKLLEKGDKEAQRADKDFITALKYGMPPTAGQGIGIDRLVNVLTNTQNIREVILFPILRPKRE
ncbi:lysine--tRNA ligase [Candidatus Parcubacteria bacterium 4484_255]|nr:MAG: lysine--tRNA ligase [Candidatus Parcubacteria bacterium 4484_255]